MKETFTRVLSVLQRVVDMKQAYSLVIMYNPSDARVREWQKQSEGG